MKKKLFVTAVLLVFSPAICLASSINRANVLKYLNWEEKNISFSADLITRTETQQKKITRNSRIYKRGAALLRVDTEPALLRSFGQSNRQLGDFFLIRNSDTQKAFFVFPEKKAYIEADTKEIKKMMEQLGGDVKDNLNGKKQQIKNFEQLGTESIEGFTCEKVHVITEDKKGIEYDVTAWLAADYNNFPLKTFVKTTMPGGAVGTNAANFQNIVRKKPAKSLFNIPPDFTKYKNLVQLSTDGKAGAGIEVLKKRLKKGGLKKRR